MKENAAGAPEIHVSEAALRAEEDQAPIGVGANIRLAVLTISDTRTKETDRSGRAILELAEEDGLEIAEYAICVDDSEAIYSIVAGWLLRPEIDAVVTTGGTGIAKRDVTLEAVRPLFEKEIAGFGELFRYLSFAEDVGTKAVLSRAAAGSAKDKALFVLPGSTGAVTLAMKRIILPEIRHIVHELTKHL
ncbi:MogA/MoaB family molybdenum cofactor biosynthesis protein [Saccharibacillus sp. CPCC 101409]|uniref:MogA/MoaB family molybdenum cofactor biosynthesis protein n=1 Tax=Saccharibacillus sp. CPCC 101409 TaxID=3058041 RepID=UPI0026711894|nr:MogA/MoaB family molybdenum cofactor biosynthesis protein [Saccharibacillus sp. CPCC 101409]MDO3412355.1 MogA/MoaB family molybdenum cofactor biosynthesis protein [Saccharibacillus sp. CPCC 101409]